MRVVTIVILLCFCKAAELRKASPSTVRSRVNHGRAGGGRRGSNLVKRYAPGLPCDVYTYLHEKYLDCQERKLVYVLSGWPQDLLHMLLARNKIRILKNNMFSKF
ncbi:LRRC17 isoform 4, partial [Pongo abelii]